MKQQPQPTHTVDAKVKNHMLKLSIAFSLIFSIIHPLPFGSASSAFLDGFQVVVVI